MRYSQSSIHSRSPLSLSACEFRASPISAPGQPNYGLVARAKGKPRLYSVRKIGRNEVVSEHPVQVIPSREFRSLRSAGLEDLCFDWDPDGPECCAVALGAGAFIGHSSQPNCYWKADYSRQTIVIRPRRPIFAGEELTIDYCTDKRRPCAAVKQSDVSRLSDEQLPKPETPKVVVTNDPSYGRTLIAVRDIRAGEHIGEAPVRVIPNIDLKHYGRIQSLVDLSHTWANKFSALVLGVPALVNHSFKANAYYDENPRRRTISLVAYKDIPAGCEVTMNYNGDPNDKSELDWTSTEREAPLMVQLVRAGRNDCVHH
jgi:hypothetical protein